MPTGQKDRSSPRIHRRSPSPLLDWLNAAWVPGADEKGHFQRDLNDPCIIYVSDIYDLGNSEKKLLFADLEWCSRSPCTTIIFLVLIALTPPMTQFLPIRRYDVGAVR